jgi:hypothetical protein
VAQWLVVEAGSDARTERDGVGLPFVRVVPASPSVTAPRNVTLVLRRGVVPWCGQLGATAFLHACSGGHLAVAQWLVAEAGSDAVSERDRVRHRFAVCVCACVCACACALASPLLCVPSE